MSGHRMQYAKVAPFKYQSFDIDYVKFTNIPLIDRKTAKEERERKAAEAAAAAAAASSKEPEQVEDKKEEVPEPGAFPLSLTA